MFMNKVYLKEETDETGMPILNQIDTLKLVKVKPEYFTVKDKEGKILTWLKIEN